jgi:hypothetical protein
MRSRPGDPAAPPLTRAQDLLDIGLRGAGVAPQDGLRGTGEGAAQTWIAPPTSHQPPAQPALPRTSRYAEITRILASVNLTAEGLLDRLEAELAARRGTCRRTEKRIKALWPVRAVPPVLRPKAWVGGGACVAPLWSVAQGPRVQQGKCSCLPAPPPPPPPVPHTQGAGGGGHSCANSPPFIAAAPQGSLINCTLTDPFHARPQ